jgi:hypothetical protein
MSVHSASKWLSGLALTFAIYALSTGPVGWIVQHSPDSVSKVLTVPAAVCYAPLGLICLVDRSGVAGNVLLSYLDLWGVQLGVD